MHKKLVKIGPVVPKIRSRTDKHTQRQTDRHAHYNTSQPYRAYKKIHKLMLVLSRRTGGKLQIHEKQHLPSGLGCCLDASSQCRPQSRMTSYTYRCHSKGRDRIFTGAGASGFRNKSAAVLITIGNRLRRTGKISSRRPARK